MANRTQFLIRLFPAAPSLRDRIHARAGLSPSFSRIWEFGVGRRAGAGRVPALSSRACAPPSTGCPYRAKITGNVRSCPQKLKILANCIVPLERLAPASGNQDALAVPPPSRAGVRIFPAVHREITGNVRNCPQNRNFGQLQCVCGGAWPQPPGNQDAHAVPPGRREAAHLPSGSNGEPILQCPGNLSVAES